MASLKKSDKLKQELTKVNEFKYCNSDFLPTNTFY